MQRALERYFDAWNDHDPAAIVASITDGGTYEDPTTGGPVSGDGLIATTSAFFQAFPDVQFDVVGVDPTGPTTAAAQWRMRGTNTGATPAGPPTGGTVDLPGADFLTYDPDADKVSKVVGYFDMATMFTQLGLQAHLTPADVEGLLAFGYSGRVDTGRDTEPGAFTVTWIEVDPEIVPKLTEVTTGVITDLMEHPGYLGTCFATIGRRNYTMSAWESVDAATEGLRRAAHKEAMRMAYVGGFGDNARGATSIWAPHRINGLFMAASGSTVPLSELEGQWL